MFSSMSTFRKVSLAMAAGGVYGVATYMTYRHFQSLQQQEKASPNQDVFAATYRNAQYQKIADSYDDRIDKDEFFMGINILRRWLISRHAKGDVLEVGAGTGRNIPYYLKNSNVIRRVVLSDASSQMLQQAQLKVQQHQQGKQTTRPQFAFMHADAMSLGDTGQSNRPTLPDNSFDTVIDTFGLCSYQDPVAVVKEMVRLCKKPSVTKADQQGGVILLLEHGRSKSWSFVTNHLDKYACQHAANWGCIWNRDLDKILQECENELEILALYTWHFGTTYYIVAQPKSQMS